MNDFSSNLGRQLYRLLPEVYRNRDAATAEGDLAQYLDACGVLLDQIHGTLLHRLADAFPDGLDRVGPPQSWLLPYFGDLVEARLVSPSETGRSKEVARAIAWRQRKGTLAAVEQIAQAVAGVEVEVQEGWKRVARTPRIGMPLLPPGAFGDRRTFRPSDPHDRRRYIRANATDAARQPGLPVATVDLRRSSRAIRSEENHPLARISRFGTHEEDVSWRQADLPLAVAPETPPEDTAEPLWLPGTLVGTPCFPDSFEDASPRTVDMRAPCWRRGHYHPRRLILYVPPPLGFFPPGWEDLPTTAIGDVTQDQPGEHVFRNQIIDGTLTVSAGRVVLQDCAVRKVVVTSPDVVDETGKPLPSLIAKDCLFEQVEVANTARLEYCTVLQTTRCSRILASDSIFTGDVTLTGLSAEAPSCLRFSRVPMALDDRGTKELGDFMNTTDEPVFFELSICQDGHLDSHRGRFGEPGCGVLHPATSRSICFGAEDGGEMGAYHRLHHCLGLKAAMDKLQDFLPLGIEAVFVPDTRLLIAPPVPEVSSLNG